jgi:tripartite-type tricarboxylate transporter receptor subunit TctC
MKPSIVLFAAVAVGITFTGPEALAADFYQGKTLKIVTGGSTGGGYDSQTRVVAAYLGKHIPGNPTVIVQNMPAGSGIASINHTYAKAPKDGTEIGQFNRDGMLARLLGHDQAAFNLEEFNWLGSPASYSDNAWVVLIRSELPHKNLEDLRKPGNPVVIGNVRSVLIPVFREALGTNIKILDGYDGRQLDLAVERGEVDGTGTGYRNVQREHPNWISENKVRFIVQFGSPKRLPALPDVPTASESAKTDEDRALIEFCELALTLGFPFAAPPGVPADRVAILRKAFDATVADPEYRAAAQKANVEVTPRGGEALSAAILKAAKTPPSLVERYKRLANEAR